LEKKMGLLSRRNGILVIVEVSVVMDLIVVINTFIIVTRKKLST
jgi:hypothetical protein